MLNGRREKWSAFATLWVVCAYPLFGFAYDITKSGGWMRDTFTWLIAGAVWLTTFRVLAHNASWWRMGKAWSRLPAALAVYHVRQSVDWLVYALYCSDPRWRWATRNVIATAFGIPREAVATVTDFGGPSLLVYGEPTVVDHILMNITLACKNGVRDVVLIQHTVTCKALVARGIIFNDEASEVEASEQIVKSAMAMVATRVPHARVWGAVMVRTQAHSFVTRLWARVFGAGVQFRWVNDKYPTELKS